MEQSLWAAIPEHLRSIDAALRKHTGRELPIDSTPVRFGSWMGGDRDGNPNVTAKVTHDVACLARWMAADLYLKEIDALRFELSMSHASDEVWRMARSIAAKHAEEQAASVAQSGGMAPQPSGIETLPGESPTAVEAAAGLQRALLRDESFVLPPDKLAAMLRRGASLDSVDGFKSPTVASPGSSAVWGDGVTTPTEGSIRGGALHPSGTASGPQSPKGGVTGRPAVMPRPVTGGLPRVETSVKPLTPERMKARGLQAARYHKTSIDNLLHPRAAGAAPYRIVLGEVRSMLVNTRRRMEELLAGNVPDEDDEWYENEDQFLAPLMAVYWSLWECGGGVIADGRLLDLIRRVRCFGLCLMKMDLRQESTRHTDALDEVTRHLGLGSYADWDEDTRIEWLIKELGSKRPLIPPGMPFTPEPKEVMDTFK